MKLRKPLLRSEDVKVIGKSIYSQRTHRILMPPSRRISIDRIFYISGGRVTNGQDWRRL
jgi:hypothetical protein